MVAMSSSGSYQTASVFGGQIYTSYANLSYTILDANIGIGTDNPEGRLHVVGGNALFDGNVGIGTTNPNASLEVAAPPSQSTGALVRAGEFSTNASCPGTVNSLGACGVTGMSNSRFGTGVYGWSKAETEGSGRGVYGEGSYAGVYGQGGLYGVLGYGVTQANGYPGRGVRGWSSSGYGVYGTSDTYYGVYGDSNTYVGVLGYTGGSSSNAGVVGYTTSPTAYGVFSYGNYGGTGSKYFIQPHPSDPSKEIHFVTLEGNENGTYFRGTSQIVNGQATIAVPEEFRLVTEPDGLTVQVTPLGPAKVWVEKKGLDSITVKGDADVAFDYFVNGLRRGYAEFEPIRENRAYQPAYRGVPYGTQYPVALQNILVGNGILNPDFTPNEATAAKLGWELRDESEMEKFGILPPAKN